MLIVLSYIERSGPILSPLRRSLVDLESRLEPGDGEVH